MEILRSEGHNLPDDEAEDTDALDSTDELVSLMADDVLENSWADEVELRSLTEDELLDKFSADEVTSGSARLDTVDAIDELLSLLTGDELLDEISADEVTTDWAWAIGVKLRSLTEDELLDEKLLDDCSADEVTRGSTGPDKLDAVDELLLLLLTERDIESASANEEIAVPTELDSLEALEEIPAEDVKLGRTELLMEPLEMLELTDAGVVLELTIPLLVDDDPTGELTESRDVWPTLCDEDSTLELPKIGSTGVDDEEADAECENEEEPDAWPDCDALSYSELGPERDDDLVLEAGPHHGLLEDKDVVAVLVVTGRSSVWRDMVTYGW
ncbi:hypothetical protein BLS_004936 [Venturia inaequalis]|uniref:Uncharacterized protein n=1 Tax=Venturia inaequalis TaxID=5025 RepID=A0A8H3V6S3_VENIN|nr:hypothetical protein BLS_004936 [Venturia inaequalis]